MLYPISHVVCGEFRNVVAGAIIKNIGGQIVKTFGKILACVVRRNIDAAKRRKEHDGGKNGRYNFLHKVPYPI